MTESISDIISKELDKMINSKKFKEIIKIMDNINEFGLCILCHAPCGHAHLLCQNCYLIESLRMKI